MSERKSERKTWSPSDESKETLVEITRLLESLQPRDRGFVVSRIAQLYVKPNKLAPAKQATSRAKHPVKQGWKAAWESSPEYRAWKDYERELKENGVTPQSSTPEQTAKLSELRACSFRARDELKVRLSAPSVKQTTPSSSSVTEEKTAPSHN
jgi:hypothetical protein